MTPCTTVGCLHPATLTGIYVYGDEEFEASYCGGCAFVLKGQFFPYLTPAQEVVFEAVVGWSNNQQGYSARSLYSVEDRIEPRTLRIENVIPGDVGDRYLLVRVTSVRDVETLAEKIRWMVQHDSRDRRPDGPPHEDRGAGPGRSGA